jgi:hypothetical protein
MIAGLRAPSIALIALLGVIALQVELVFSKSINWDEFFHYSMIEASTRGEPVQWLQVPFVWLFGWVPSLPGDTIAHIQLIRLLTLPFTLFTCWVIFDSARRIASPDAGWICTLAFLTGGHIFLHGFALRADMIATALLMGAMWIAMWRPWRAMELAAIALLGLLALLSTIKSAFYLPVFLGIAVMRREQFVAWLKPSRSLPLAVVIVLLVAAGFAMAGDIVGLARSSARRMFNAGLFPESRFFTEQLRYAAMFSAMIAFTPLVLWLKRREIAHPAALALFLLPLATLAFYRNAFPYFYPFILAPAAIAVAPVAAFAAKHLGTRAIALLLLANAAFLSLVEDRSVLARQQAVISGVAEIFPEPVRYIDDAGMIGDYPRAVDHFSSGWALSNYRFGGEPEYSAAMRSAQTPLLIRNGPGIDSAWVPRDDGIELLPEDAKFLRANFIPHWGNVFVAGREIVQGEGQIEIVAHGSYTLEGAPITIAGTAIAPGDVIKLDSGAYNVSAESGAATLRFGDHLAVPSAAWPEGPLFTDF